jgi:hypothetical protein
MTAEHSLSEWMRVMLEEIGRKRAEQEEMRVEEERRRDEQRNRGEPNARSI